jgi:hypothetical protein
MIIARAPKAEPAIWHAHPKANPPYLPYLRNSGPEGTLETAAPMRNVPMVKGAKISELPVRFAANGPIVVNKVDVVKVNAQHKAKFIRSFTFHLTSRGIPGEEEINLSSISRFLDFHKTLCHDDTSLIRHAWSHTASRLLCFLADIARRRAAKRKRLK